MSNILKAITFLKNNPEKRFLKIQDENGNSVGLEKNFLKDIPNENLENYLKSYLGTITKDRNIWIEAREESGATHKKMGSFSVVIAPEKTAVSEPVQNAPMQQQQVYQPQNHATTSEFLGNAVQAGNGMMLVSTQQVLEMQRKADKLDDANEKLYELRNEHVEVKKKFNDADTENRDLKTKLQTAEAQKDLAVQLAKTENKGFLESAAFEKLLDKAPEMLGNIAALKAGGMPQMESLGAASTLSETKQGFVDYVTEDLNDEQVNYLGSICHFLPNEGFKNDLKTLITKYHGS
jgi:hypothetical protein